MEGALIALELMGYGLGGVFLSLILLYFIIRLMGRIFKEKEKKNESVEEER